ncbi:hypothetical protein BISA_0841 [Bifidobacterium saguini DSM 23967]|uniref:Head fiber protein n=2 Tax=Bifidobacterium saguini TaxID=762210 RepID=A0A087DA91_9BIFI|nr:hypothetical protein [Bifidobacterium saguini]KFI92441.1 hypothetical protein BISA_0841 [Bifidobacterium saguini DSM 23967]QTB90833.1 hypothetical protein BSD967_11215 [Bifidobacterium saguini]
MSQAVEFHHLTSGVTNDAKQAVIETQFVDENGDPVDIGGGSATPADGSVTNAMLAGGITADKLAAGVIPTVPKAAYVADPAGDAPTKAEYVALRDALVTAGLMSPKA